MKVIDCFPFFNELDILEIRLEELYEVVDFFVLVEASKSQSMMDKPFYFDENKVRYEKYLDKIIHIKVTEYPEFTHSWAMENFQRDLITLGLKKINEMNELNNEDTIIVSDLDEVISKNSINNIVKNNFNIGVVELDFFVYFMNFKANRKWKGPVFCKIKNFIGKSPQTLRNIKDGLPVLKTEKCSGWHFGWMGGFEKMYYKLFSCIEPLDKSKIPSYDDYVNIMNQSIKNKKFFNIDYNPNSESFKIVSSTEQEYPEYLKLNQQKFKQYFYEI